MALREEFETWGNWLFRWRSYPPLFLIVPMLITMHDPGYILQRARLPWCWTWVCLGVSFAGLGIRAIVAGYAPFETSGQNTKLGQVAAALNTTAMYSVVRHPLYLGNFTIWIGVSLFCGFWWLSALFALAFWAYYERIMFAEEEFLRRKFGTEYVNWAACTPAFLPRLTGWRPSPLPFSLRTVLRKEYSGMFGIVACFYALEVYGHVVDKREYYVEPVWTAVFLVGMTVFLVLRTLKQRTTLLAVAGR